ncbi:hypothetical protein D3C80_1051930 [compost metagenome]
MQVLDTDPGRHDAERGIENDIVVLVEQGFDLFTLLVTHITADDVCMLMLSLHVIVQRDAVVFHSVKENNSVAF